MTTRRDQLRNRTWRIYIEQIGRPGHAAYKPKRDLGTVQAPNEQAALRAVAKKIGQEHVGRNRSVPVMGVGSIKVRPE